MSIEGALFIIDEVNKEARRTVRIEREEYLAELCHLIAQRGTCSRAKVGAAIVRDGRIVSTGYNGSPPGLPHCDETDHKIPVTQGVVDHGPGCRNAVHAEANAIAFAARNGVPTEGAELWCTHEPCLPCAQIMVSAGIRRVVYTKEYRDHDGRALLLQAGVEVCRYED